MSPLFGRVFPRVFGAKSGPYFNLIIYCHFHFQVFLPVSLVHNCLLLPLHALNLASVFSSFSSSLCPGPQTCQVLTICSSLGGYPLIVSLFLPNFTQSIYAITNTIYNHYHTSKQSDVDTAYTFFYQRSRFQTVPAAALPTDSYFL